MLDITYKSMGDYTTSAIIDVGERLRGDIDYEDIIYLHASGDALEWIRTNYPSFVATVPKGQYFYGDIAIMILRNLWDR